MNTAVTPSGPLKTFLRGGQVTLHTLRMFGQVIRFLAASMLLLMIAVTCFGTWANTNAIERHYAFKRYEAWFYQAITGDPGIELNVLTSSGERRPFSVAAILQSPTVAEHERSFRSILTSWSIIGSAGGGTLFAVLVGLFLQRGTTLIKSGFRRGAQKTSAADLIARIRDHNRITVRRTLALRGRPEYMLAGVPYPIGTEVQHTAISGTIGSGKTVAITNLIEQIRRHGDRAVVFDLTGGFIGPFFREGRDVILNPMDLRSASWSVFSEVHSKANFDAVAAAMIAKGKHGDPVWADSARLVFSTAAQLLVSENRATNDELVNLLLCSDNETLGQFFEGTPAASIISPDTPRMTNSVRMMLNTYLDGIRLLQNDNLPFSIKDWIEDEEDDRFLFLSSRADMHETLKPLLTVWMDTAVRILMSQPRDPSRRIWFVMDEVAALQKMPSIMDGLARGRQFGAAFVLGIQAQSQLREIYGPDGAQSLSSVCRTKLILAAADADTAKWYADFLGREESTRTMEGVQFGANTIRDGVSLNRQDKTEHLIIPEEILNLRSLEGFLKMSEGFPLASVKVPFVPRADNVPPFLPRPESTLLVTRRSVSRADAEQRERKPESEDGHDPESARASREKPDELKDLVEPKRTRKAAAKSPSKSKDSGPKSKASETRTQQKKETRQLEFPDWSTEV